MLVQQVCVVFVKDQGVQEVVCEVCGDESGWHQSVVRCGTDL